MKSGHSDKGKKLLFMRLESAEKSILSAKTLSYSLQSNCVAERMNRTLMNKVCAIMKDAVLLKVHRKTVLLRNVFV